MICLIVMDIDIFEYIDPAVVRLQYQRVLYKSTHGTIGKMNPILFMTLTRILQSNYKHLKREKEREGKEKTANMDGLGSESMTEKTVAERLIVTRISHHLLEAS